TSSTNGLCVSAKLLYGVRRRASLAAAIHMDGCFWRLKLPCSLDVGAWCFCCKSSVNCKRSWDALGGASGHRSLNLALPLPPGPCTKPKGRRFFYPLSLCLEHRSNCSAGGCVSL